MELSFISKYFSSWNYTVAFLTKRNEFSLSQEFIDPSQRPAPVSSDLRAGEKIVWQDFFLIKLPSQYPVNELGTTPSGERPQVCFSSVRPHKYFLI
jgi:hypothetical protein